MTQTDIINTFQDICESLLKLLNKHKVLTIWKSAGRPIKPFTCPLCLSFWIGLIFTFVYNQFTFVNLLYILIIAINNDIISDLYLLLKGTIQKIIFTLQNYVL